MAVRIRLSTVNVQAALNTADFYISHGFPVLLTFMRYRDHINVPTPMDYEKRLSIKNEYYCIKPSAYLRLLKQFRGTGAKTCGTAVSNKCIDCRNCELFYWMWMAKSGRTLDEFEMAKRLYEAMRDEHQYYLESQGCGPTLLSSWEQIKENKREMNSLLAQARAAINYTRTATRT